MKDKVMQTQNEPVESGKDFRQEMTEALLYTHNRLSANTAKILESSAFLYALIELLSEKMGITMEELDERRRVMSDRLAAEFRARGMGAMLQEPEYDKYNFEGGVKIECEDRVHLCKASCCRLQFAISTQDIREGIIRWNLGRPYMIEQGMDSYCIHFERGKCRCTVYENRPVLCRAFDCRNDKRIWLDFEKKIPNPAVNRPDWLEYVSQEAKENQ